MRVNAGGGGGAPADQNPSDAFGTHETLEPRWYFPSFGAAMSRRLRGREAGLPANAVVSWETHRRFVPSRPVPPPELSHVSSL